MGPGLRDDWRVAADSRDALIAEGRAAFEQGDARSSRHAFEAALAERESGELLEGLARALYLEVDYPGSIEAHQRAFAAYKGEGDPLSCARVARLLSWQHVNVYGDFAVAGGWLARAEELLEQTGDNGAEHGWIQLLRAPREPHGEGRDGAFGLRSRSAGGSRMGTSGSLRWPCSARHS